MCCWIPSKDGCTLCKVLFIIAEQQCTTLAIFCTMAACQLFWCSCVHSAEVPTCQEQLIALCFCLLCLLRLFGVNSRRIRGCANHTQESQGRESYLCSLYMRTLPASYTASVSAHSNLAAPEPQTLDCRSAQTKGSLTSVQDGQQVWIWRFKTQGCGLRQLVQHNTCIPGAALLCPAWFPLAVGARLLPCEAEPPADSAA